MKRILTIAALVALCGAAAPAWAETRAAEWSFSPFIGGYIFEADEALKTKPVYGVRLGYNLTSRFGLEAAFDYLRTESKVAPVDVDGYLYHLDGLFHLMTESRFVPYLAAGLGAISLDPDPGKTDSDFFLNYGLGAKFAFSRAIGLRADVRHIMPYHDSPTFNNLEYTLGLTFAWGGATPEPMRMAAPPPPSPPADADRDGVPDTRDRCLGTPAGTEVDSSGCPADRDRDGVPDSADRCPGSPAGQPVDRHGCPLDGDGDGVPDQVDQCPDTPRGAAVDRNGCPPPPPKPADEKVSIELAVEFDTNKADIKPKYRSEIQRVVDFMKANPRTSGEVEGHTDNVGSASANVALSQRRADAVRNALIDQGIDASRLTAKGYGPSNPIADNKTPQGRERNRRVVVTISGVK